MPASTWLTPIGANGISCAPRTTRGSIRLVHGVEDEPVVVIDTDEYDVFGDGEDGTP